MLGSPLPVTLSIERLPFSETMWQLIQRLLQLILLTASASTLFVVSTAIVTLFPTPDTYSEFAAPSSNKQDVEVRVSTQGEPPYIFLGQPLVVNVELINLKWSSVQNQEPDETANQSTIQLDNLAIPWEHRLTMTVSTDDNAEVLENLDWREHLLKPPAVASGRRLGAATVHTTFILDIADLESLVPGDLTIRAALPKNLVPPEQVRLIPLTLNLRPPPANDPDRALVSMSIARSAVLRNEPTAAMNAALTTLALDPLQDEALIIIAQYWETQGDLSRAIEWYKQYLDTLSKAEAHRRTGLEAYLDALGRQR